MTNKKLKPAAGWIKTGYEESKYDTGFDQDTERNGSKCACIRSKSDDAPGFATLMKMIDAGEHRGQRLKMTVWTKTDSVEHWAGAWMRIDGNLENKKQPYFAFDNMQNRPISGTTDWTMQSVVLDVDAAATNIAYGVLMNGPGTVWMDDFQFEDVDDTVALTNQSKASSNKSKSFSAHTSDKSSTASESLPLPKGWIRAGSHPNEYDMGIDDKVKHSGTKSARIRSNTDNLSGFGTLMQIVDAGSFRGNRCRLTGWAKWKDVTGWAGMWMSVNGQRTTKPLAFDNMQERPLKGTSDWAMHEIVLDVPQESSNIAFGVLLNGAGEAWMDDFKFEQVGLDVPPTESNGYRGINDSPVNLNFEDGPDDD